MSKMDFSPKQEEAISASGSNYLISAGAGSGKTAVLTERIYRLAKEDKSLDHFLVLTFTNLAAAEMKDRVRKKLLEDEETLYLASEVDNAHIETFDSFSLYLVKKYFYLLGISKDISIVDNSILSIKRKKFLSDIFEERFANEDEKFLKLIDNYATKNTDVINDFIINILELGDKKADNYAFFSHLRNDFYSKEVVDSSIKKLIDEKKRDISFVINKSYELEDAEDVDQILEQLSPLLEISDYDELYNALKESFPRKKSKDATDGEYRDKIAGYYNKYVKITKDNDFGNREEITNHYLELKPYIEVIFDIVIEVEKRLDAFKKEYNAYSFGDISRFVLKLLNNKDIKEEISNSFKYIMVDEYQDTNDIQETVISLISKNNVYMVGDVKQSIYRFRGADCHIFQEKYESYKKEIGGKEIDLNTSYRSREEVVDFINDLFSQIFTKENNAIDYSNGHKFGFGRSAYNINKPDCSYKPEIYRFTYEKSQEVVEKECEIIIRDIKQKIHDHYQVYNGKEHHNCSYKDFAIIVDRSGAFDTYRRMFSEANIPLNVQDKETLFKSDIISVVKNLIKMLYYSLNSDYGSNYKHAYLSVARSFLFEYHDDDLYDIYQNKAFLNERFAQQIELIKEKLRFASLKDIFLTLYEEFDIYSSISKITQYYANAHKLEQLITIAEMMDTLNYTLEDLVEYFDDLSELDVDIDYRDSNIIEDSVTLINIHKSKGLEYGIVYYPGLSKAFNQSETQTCFLISDTYGPIIPSVDSDKSSLIIHLIRDDLSKADFEEKLRLLYVALTRAKEKIILVSAEKESKSKFKKASNSKCMNDILKLTDAFDKYSSEYSTEDVELNLPKSKDEKVNKITLKQVNVTSKEVIKLRASKELEEDIDESVLDFGSHLHAYLENVDLDNRSTEYIQDMRMRRYVNNVINSPLFKGIHNKDVRHEFPFYDEDSGVQGYIDALIIKDDEVNIIDFKLKHIDDEEYDKQLRTYKSYIKKITNKPIKMFLLAAITGEIREVKDE